MTPKEFDSAIRDNNKVKQMQLEEMNKTIFESMRLQTLMLHNMNPYRKKGLKKVTELLKFPWEKAKVQSVDEMKSVLKAIAISFKSKKGK